MRLKTFLARRMLAVAAACLLGFSALAAWQALQKVRTESQGAAQLQWVARQLSQLQGADAAQAERVVAELQRVAGSGALRHLRLRLSDGAQEPLVATPPDAPAGWMAVPARALAQWIRRADPAPEATERWTMAGADGRQWQVELTTDPASEENEAIQEFLTLALMIAALTGAMVGGVALALRQVLQPVQAAGQALARLGAGDYAVQLPGSPLAEVAGMNRSIEALAAALAELEAARKMLGTRLLGLQEDERARIARELHDEMGQRLTAIRLNAAYLRRAGPLPAPLEPALRDIETSVQGLQGGLRELLAQLRPQGAGPAFGNADLANLVDELVSSWRRRHGGAVAFDLVVDASGPELAPELLLALYRMTQEGLTNVARHSQATEVRLRLNLRPPEVHWQIEDNGTGGTTLSQADTGAGTGSGLSGMRERVWLLGGRFELSPGPGGWKLAATLPWRGAAQGAGTLPA